MVPGSRGAVGSRSGNTLEMGPGCLGLGQDWGACAPRAAVASRLKQGAELPCGIQATSWLLTGQGSGWDQAGVWHQVCAQRGGTGAFPGPLCSLSLPTPSLCGRSWGSLTLVPAHPHAR